MAKKAEVWMPLYIGDYLADTRRLTTEQHGAYLLLLMDYWRNGPPPDDVDTLRQITLMTADAWSIAQAKLVHLFTVIDGHWHHKRVDEELAKAQANQGKAQAKAKAAADARWGKSRENAPSNAPSNATSITQALHKECPSPSPSPSSIKDLKDKGAPPAGDAGLFPNVDPQVVADFKALRKAKKAAITPTAMKQIANEAEKAGLTLQGALELCCSRGWQGFEAKFVEPRDSDRRGAGRRAGQDDLYAANAAAAEDYLRRKGHHEG